MLRISLTLLKVVPVSAASNGGGTFVREGVFVLGDVVREHLSREPLSGEGMAVGHLFRKLLHYLFLYTSDLFPPPGYRNPLLRIRVYLLFLSVCVRLTVRLLSLCCNGCKMLPSDRSSCSMIISRNFYQERDASENVHETKKKHCRQNDNHLSRVAVSY